MRQQFSVLLSLWDPVRPASRSYIKRFVPHSRFGGLAGDFWCSLATALPVVNIKLSWCAAEALSL